MKQILSFMILGGLIGFYFGQKTSKQRDPGVDSVRVVQEEADFELTQKSQQVQKVESAIFSKQKDPKVGSVNEKSVDLTQTQQKMDLANKGTVLSKAAANDAVNAAAMAAERLAVTTEEQKEDEWQKIKSQIESDFATNAANTSTAANSDGAFLQNTDGELDSQSSYSQNDSVEGN